MGLSAKDVLFRTLICSLFDDNRIYSHEPGLVIVNYGDNDKARELLEFMREQLLLYQLKSFEYVNSGESYDNEIKMVFKTPELADDFLTSAEEARAHYDEPLVCLINYAARALLLRTDSGYVYERCSYERRGTIVSLTDLHSTHLYTDFYDVFEKYDWLGGFISGNEVHIDVDFSNEYLARRFICLLEKRLWARH